MQALRTDEGVHFLRLDLGDTFPGDVPVHLERQGVRFATVQGIGAFREARIGYLDHSTGRYGSQVVRGDLEVVSLLGNVTLKDGKPFFHVHTTIATKEGTTLAGHLFEAEVGATLELFVHPLAAEVRREKHPDLDLMRATFPHATSPRATSPGDTPR